MQKTFNKCKRLGIFQVFFELNHNDTSTQTTKQLFHYPFSTKSITLLHLQQTKPQLITSHPSLLTHFPTPWCEKHQLTAKKPLQIAMALSILHKLSGRFNAVHLNILALAFSTTLCVCTSTYFVCSSTDWGRVATMFCKFVACSLVPSK